jgi:diguanylate cyclase (GGDEF)-like protein
MTDLKQMAFSARAEHARELATSLGLAPDAWGVVMLTLLERTDTHLAIKEIATGRYVYATSGMQALMGCSAQGLVDQDWVSLEACSAMHLADHSAMTQTVPQISEHRFELTLATAQNFGVPQEFSVTRLPLPMLGGGNTQYVCSLWGDIKGQRQLHIQHQLALQQLEALQQSDASHQHLAGLYPGPRDGATGFYPYSHFEDQLRRELDLSAREHREFAMVSVALDTLSPDAQQLGPQAKARVLEALGRLLRSNTRAMDASCHTVEGQFMVMLSGVGLATAHSRMEGLRRQCATQIVMLEGQSVAFSVAMGVASFPHTARSQAELLCAAHAALAEAQRRGGNHVALASIRFEQNHL